MKAMEINDVERFPFPTPPDAKGLEEAMNTLSGMGALNVQDGSITNLGSMLAKFPVGSSRRHMLCPFRVDNDFRSRRPHVNVLLVSRTLATPLVLTIGIFLSQVVQLISFVSYSK